MDKIFGKFSVFGQHIPWVPMHDLHWLPLEQHIIFRLCSLMHLVIIIIIITRLVTRHMSIVVKRWIAGADGLPWWSSSQVLANNYGVCGVWVCVLLCLIFIIAVHLGNKVIVYPLSPLTLQVTVNSCNATQTILNHSVPEICKFSNGSHPLFVIVATHLPTSKGWKPEFSCLSREYIEC